MAMGTRQQRERQQGLWIPAADIRRGGGHPFYQRLNSLLDEEGFDPFVEGKVRTRATRPRWGGRWPRPGEQIATVLAHPKAGEQVNPQGLEEVVADKGYHSSATQTELREFEVRSYISEPKCQSRQ